MFIRLGSLYVLEIMNNIVENKHFFFIGALILAVIFGFIIGYFFRTGKNTLRVDKEEELRSIYGTITSIQNYVLAVNALIPFTPDDIRAEKRKVMVTARTKIEEGRIKSPEELVAESNISPPAPPYVFLRGIRFEDLKTGDEIIMDSDDNVRRKSRFNAVRILRIKRESP